MAGTSSIPIRNGAGRTDLGGSDLVTSVLPHVTGPVARHRLGSPLRPTAAIPARELHDDLGRATSTGLRTVRASTDGLGTGLSRNVVLVVVVLVGPAMAAVVAVPGERLATAATAATVVTGLLLLGIAGLLYALWRMGGVPVVGWLSTAALALVVEEVPFLAFVATGSARPYVDRGELLDVVVATVALGLALAALGRRPWRLRPATLGLGLGLALVGLRLTTVNEVGLSGVPYPALMAVLMLATATAVVVAVGNVRAAPDWVRHQAALAVLVMVAGMCLERVDGPPLLTLVATTLGVVGAALLASVGIGLLRLGVERHSTELEDLARRADVAEAGVRRDEEVLHELRTALGGVSTATTLLLRRSSELPGAQRRRLEQLVETELQRLGSMVQHEPRCGTALHALDELVEPLVTAQVAQGREVTCTPSGIWLDACAHHVVETVGILLANAARHAPGAPVHVSTEVLGATAHLRVADTGPGVPAELRSRLFERGFRGPGSPGLGLGLHVARRVARDHGGDVHVEAGRPGGSFVVTLPIHARSR